MRRITLLCAFALLLQVTAGCDFFRVVAGRPTAAELAEKQRQDATREMAERLTRAREQAARDSVTALKKSVSDSVDAETFFKESKISRIHSSSLPGLRTADLSFRYCVILASLSLPENAVQFSARLRDAGYEPVVMKYTRGQTSLMGVGPTDDFSAVRETYERVRAEKFCPKDAWIFIKD
ncbi:MAG: hypothetical protein IJ654_08855 [Bacteroidales bacterium]|nr:hypothetical protein [Bacteroidales bacterium]